MSDSTNLLLPYLDGAQAQKHVTVNEGLRKLDALVLLAVEDKDLTAPPGSPADGSRYIPKATATGIWSGKENHIAHYVDGTWEFYAPREGFIAYIRDEDQLYVHNASAWVKFLGQIPGMATNDNAAAGMVGEYVESEVLVADAVSVTSATDTNVASISLAAGDWDVWGVVAFVPASGTAVTKYYSWSNNASATFPTAPNKGGLAVDTRNATGAGGTDLLLHAGTRRFSLSATTTIYLSCHAVFTVSTMTAYGFVAARRVR